MRRDPDIGIYLSMRQDESRLNLYGLTHSLYTAMICQLMANRLVATKADDSPAKVIEEIGIKGRSSDIKPVKGDDVPGYIEDAADVRIEGLSANELANLLFRLEKGTRPVKVKKALIKQRFDDPAKLDVALNIALIKPAPVGAR